MGNIEVPSQNSKQTIKVPIGTYEFGANVISEKVCAAVWLCECVWLWRLRVFAAAGRTGREQVLVAAAAAAGTREVAAACLLCLALKKRTRNQNRQTPPLPPPTHSTLCSAASRPTAGSLAACAPS